MKVAYFYLHLDLLLALLCSAQVRWHETLESLGSQSKTLLGDSVLMAACLVYIGQFTPTYRQTLLSKWKHTCQENKLHTDTQFSLEENLVEPEQVGSKWLYLKIITYLLQINIFFMVLLVGTNMVCPGPS